MAPAELAFLRPSSLEEALAALASEGALAYAGGTSLGLLVKNRLTEADTLVALGGVAALGGIAEDAGELRIGATVTLWELARSAEVRRVAPSLATAAAAVGNPRVRSLATVGGALAHGDPRQDVPPVLLSLGARARVAGAGGAREVALSDLLTGFMQTALDAGELITEVRVPVAPQRRAAYLRFTPGSADDYPTVGVAAALERGDDGRVRAAQVALGGVGPVATLVPGVPDVLVGTAAQPELVRAAAEAAVTSARPTDDQRGSARYKAAMVAVVTRRALEACLGR